MEVRNILNSTVPRQHPGISDVNIFLGLTRKYFVLSQQTNMLLYAGANALKNGFFTRQKGCAKNVEL